MAHPTRDQGITPELMRDTFIVAEFKLWPFLLGTQGQPLALSDLPTNFLEIIQIVRRGLTAQILKRETGMKSGLVNDTLASMQTAFALNARGRISLVRELSQNEWVLLKTLTQFFTVQPAFTQKDLFADFLSALRLAGLVGESDKLPPHISEWLSLAAIEIMHQARLEVGHRNAPLRMHVDPYGSLGVVMHMAPPPEADPRTSFCFEIMSTNLKSEDHCEGWQPNSTIAFTQHLELGPNAKLRLL